MLLQLQNCRQLLEASIAERHARKEETLKRIGSDVDSHFLELMTARGHSANVNFDHENQRLITKVV